MILRFFFSILCTVSMLHAFQLINIKPNLSINLVKNPSSYLGDLPDDEAYVKCQTNQFQSLLNKPITFGIKTTPLWICLEVLNTQHEHLFLSLSDISIENATFFKYQNNKLTEKEESGLWITSKRDDFEELISKTYIPKSPTPTTVLIKLSSSSPFLTEIVLGDNHDIINTQLAEIVILSIFIGTFLSLFIYNGFLYFSTKQNDYMLYALYILFLVTWMISFHGYFTYFYQLSDNVTHIIKTLFILGTILFLILFSIKFLNIKQKYSTIFYVFLFIVLSILLFLLMMMTNLLGHYVGELSLLIVTSACLYWGILSYKNNPVISKYYVIALSGYLIGTLISFLMFEGILLTHFYSLYAQLVGSLWTMIILSLALAYKLSLLEVERNEAVLKSQVQEKMLFLQSRNASIGELIGNIAHQWREPLAEIGAIHTNLHATLLIKGSVTKEKMLDSIEQSNNILHHLSNTIEVFYRFFKYKKYDKQEFNITEEIYNIQKMVYYILKVENITLQIEHQKEIFLHGDKNEFANVILNIILNAKDILVNRKIKNPLIDVKIYKNNNIIFITIEDNAGGIKQDPVEKVFESGVSSKDTSIGIGLYIAKTIVEKRLKGKIDVENSDNGALFTISFPVILETVEKDDTDIFLNTEESTLRRLYKLEQEVEKQEELEKALNQWEEIFKKTHWGVAVFKGKSTFVEMINPEFEKMYGYSLNELKNMSITGLFAVESFYLLITKQEEAFEKSFVSFEAVNIKKDGTKFPANIDLTVIKNDNNDVLYYIANIRDITEQKNISNALKTSEEAFRAMVENSPDVIMRYDKECRRTYINPLGLVLMGKPPEELLGKTPKEFSPLSDIEAFEEAFYKVLNEAKEIKIEGVFYTHDGEKRWGEERIIPELNSKGEVSSVLVIGRDMTEQKRANERLLLKKFALDNIEEAVYLMNEKGELTYVNEGACRTLGYTEAELLSLNIGDIDADWPIERWSEHWEVIKEVKTMTMELRHKRKDGRIFPVEVLANYFEYEGIAYNMGLARDITERKAIQENLLLKGFALNKINESVFLIDENANFHYVNEATCKSLGYTHDELLKLTVADLDPNVSITWWKEHWKDIERLNNTLTLTQHKRKDGTVFPIEISSNYFEYNGVGYSLAVSRDISERLEVQKRKDEEKMRLFFDHQLVGMAITSPTKGWLHVNDKLCEMLGYSFEELKNMTWAEVTHPDDLPADVDSFERMLAGEIESYTVEKRYICKDESIVFAYLSIGCVRKEDGSVDFVLALIEDITERKKSEEKIRILNSTLEERVKERTLELAKKEREFRTLAENMPNFLSRYDKEGKRIYVNPPLCEYFGVSSDELLGFSPQKKPLIGVPAELYEKITYVLQTGYKTYMEIADNKDDTKRWWTLSFVPEFDEKGNIDGVISIGHDITYIKQAEEQMQLLTSAINNASDALYIVAHNRSIKHVSEASCKMLGYTYDEFMNMKVEDIDPFMKVEDIDGMREKVDKLNTVTFQTNHRAKDGKILDVEITVTKFIFNESDLRLSMVKDITQLKKHEATINELNKNLEIKVIERTKELQQAVEFNKSIIQAIPDMLFEVSKEGIYLNIWARDEKLLADQKELLLGKNFKDILPPDAVEVSIKTFKEVEKYGSSLGNIYKLDLPDGEHWFELHTTKKESEDTYLALARDITERKKAQNELIELNTTLEDKVKDRTYSLQKALEWSEDIINTLPDLLFEIDNKGNYQGVWTQNKELLAQQKEELLGNNIYDVLSKEASDTIMHAFEEVNKYKYSSGKKITIHLPQGKKEFELSISKKSDGNFLVLSRDITQRNS
ncbi:MAG: PAS domain S-box protein [Arcobacter sp.]|uniref:PAS domain S-box protein n=1 Tax=Arcobacter sp. TaxID=1872629 RepID=UPI003AFF655E